MGSKRVNHVQAAGLATWARQQTRRKRDILTCIFSVFRLDGKRTVVAGQSD